MVVEGVLSIGVGLSAYSLLHGALFFLSKFYFPSLHLKSSLELLVELSWANSLFKLVSDHNCLKTSPIRDLSLSISPSQSQLTRGFGVNKGKFFKCQFLKVPLTAVSLRPTKSLVRFGEIARGKQEGLKGQMMLMSLPHHTPLLLLLFFLWNKSIVDALLNETHISI